MNKALSVVIAFVLLSAFVLADTTDGITQTVTTGVGIGIGVEPANSCPEIVQEHGECDGQESPDGSVCYWVNTATDIDKTCNNDPACVSACNELVQQQGRSYAFEGEEVNFELDVLDKDGIIDDCVKVYVTLDDGVDPIEAGCRLAEGGVSSWTDPHGVVYNNALGHFLCTYTVEPAEGGTQGTYWISVEANDQCGAGLCPDHAAGLVSLYLNPAVSLTISSQDQFGFNYDIGGSALTEGPFAGETVYSPYFTVENTADPSTGLYILLQLYGTDMWDYGESAAMCPTSNVLDIKNVWYKASHLNVQQPWTPMPENYANKGFVFTPGPFGGNFLGVGDDVTMRLRLNIPSPCRGNFNDGGEIVFVGHVL